MDTEDIREKIVFMIKHLDREGLEKSYKLIQRIWIKQDVMTAER